MAWTGSLISAAWAALAWLLVPPAIAALDSVDPSQAAEAAIIAAHGDYLRRDGEQLEIRLPGLEAITFRDRSCEQLEGDDCIHYRLDAVFPDRDTGQPALFGVEESYYEGHSYMILTRDGTMIETGERPVPSPDGLYFVSAASSDSHPPDTGLLVLRVTERGGLYPVRAIPTGALTNFTDLRWLAPGCIAFLASVTDEWGAYGAQREFRLVEAAPEWALTSDAVDCTVPATSSPQRKEVNLSVPLVVRPEGTNVEKGKAILANSGLPIVSADDLGDAAKKFVAEVKQAA